MQRKKATFQRLVKTMEQGYRIGFAGKKAYEKREELYADRTNDAH